MENRLAQLLEEQGYKPASFAREAGIPVTTLYEILNGTRKFENVGVSRIIKIAKRLGVSVEYLSGEIDEPKKSEERIELMPDEIRLVSYYRRMTDQDKETFMNNAQVFAIAGDAKKAGNEPIESGIEDALAALSD